MAMAVAYNLMKVAVLVSEAKLCHISRSLFSNALCVTAFVLGVLLLQVLDVADDTISIRSLDWDRDRFDIEFGLQEGTTYNSFLIFGDKTCLVDASHEKFRDLYMNTLKAELKKRNRTLDYVVVSHTEPDHSGKMCCLSLIQLANIIYGLVQALVEQSAWH